MNLSLPIEFKALISNDTKLKYYSKNPLKKMLIKGFFNKLSALVQGLNPREIIEIGCGDGISGYLINQNLKGLEYYLADLQSESLIVASKVIKITDSVKLDARELPYADKSFDLALCLEVFEHIQGWERAFDEAIRVSRKALIFSIPAYPWYQWSNLIFLKNVARMGEHPQHINQFQYRKTLNKIEMLSRPLNLKVNIQMAFPWLIGIARF